MKNIYIKTIGKIRIIDIAAFIDRVESGDHLLAALKILRTYGCIPNTGYDVSITGKMAINAGTSGPRAVLIAWIQFLIVAFGCKQRADKEFISQIAFEAEMAFHGAREECWIIIVSV